ncbi:MAG: GNAT family N-acetyltransferase [Pseudomonadota bacterium]
MNFSFRTLNSEDAEAWVALRLEGVQQYPLGFLVTEKEALSMKPERASSILNLGKTCGVFDHELLIGFCGFRPESLEQTKHRAELGPFFVKSAYHGTGAADTLMHGVIAEAKRVNIEQIELFVDTENKRALQFYLRHGFEVIATHPDGVRIAGQQRDDYFCRLRISNS